MNKTLDHTFWYPIYPQLFINISDPGLEGRLFNGNNKYYAPKLQNSAHKNLAFAHNLTVRSESGPKDPIYWKIITVIFYTIFFENIL